MHTRRETWVRGPEHPISRIACPSASIHRGFDVHANMRRPRARIHSLALAPEHGSPLCGPCSREEEDTVRIQGLGCLPRAGPTRSANQEAHAPPRRPRKVRMAARALLFARASAHQPQGYSDASGLLGRLASFRETLRTSSCCRRRRRCRRCRHRCRCCRHSCAWNDEHWWHADR
jgi:hypothetical protein